jgi:hypothetical protein
MARMLLALICISAILPVGAQTPTDGADALRQRHMELQAELTNNHYGRPLHLQSSETSGELQGDIHALIRQPFTQVGPAMLTMEQWCDILILHLNVKHCRPERSAAGDMLRVHLGRKFHQPLDDAHELTFRYRIKATSADYLHIALDAGEGPLGTHNYRIMVEMAPLDDNSSLLHLSYSYGFGVRARLAMQGYLATLGRDKVGFSFVRRTSSGKPVYRSDLRGVVERNTMRYYLAIEAYLGALATPAAQQQEKRLRDWHAGVERYPQQLHELERDEYLQMKRREIRRQRARLNH